MLRRVVPYVFEAAVAIVFVLVGLAYLFSSGAAEHSPIGRAVHPFDTAWSVLYVVAGPLIVVGVVRGLPRVRVPGLILLSTGLLMQGVAGLLVGPGNDPRVGAYFVYAGAAGLRASYLAHLVVRGRRRG